MLYNNQNHEENIYRPENRHYSSASILISCNNGINYLKQLAKLRWSKPMLLNIASDQQEL